MSTTSRARSRERERAEIGVSNPDQSVWQGGPEGEVLAPPADAVPRRNEDDEDDEDDDDTVDAESPRARS
jgi:hypothetical protein